MVDARDGLFGDWCELNFKEGVPEPARQELALDYHELQKLEGSGTIFLASVVLAADPAGPSDSQ